MGVITVFLFLVVFPLHMKFIECYPQKRDVNSLPQVITLLSEGQHMQMTQTHLLENITTTLASTLPQVVGLLQNITATQSMPNEKKVVASLETLTKGFTITARDCSDIAEQGPYRSGPYTITPWDEQGSFKAYCDMTTENGGWTVFQKRFDGSVDFYLDWEDYKHGFGNIDGEFWIGLDKLNRLTSSGESWQLRVELEDFDGNMGYAEYDNFRIGEETTNFQLIFDTYVGTAGDSLTNQANMAFSTKDRDNDLWGDDCALSYKGGWWYNSCHYSNLNGLYLGSPQATPTGMTWYHFTSSSYKTLKRSEMKIRPIH